MGSRLMLNGRWRIILGHGSDRRYVYCDSWEEAEKAIRCERTEARVRDAKRGGELGEAESKEIDFPRDSRKAKVVDLSG